MKTISFIIYKLLSAKGADVKYMFNMKKLFLFFTLLLSTTIAMSQIKVATNGNVGIGTNDPYSNCKLTVKQGANDIILKPDSGSDRIMIGGYSPSQSSPEIEFYHPKFGFNKVKFKSYSLGSDTALKTNITLLENATTILKKIRTYSYYFKSDIDLFRPDSLDERKKDYGVLAQEIEKILPELVDTCFNTMFVNYNAFIAILIKGFNEQQNEIEILQNIVSAQEIDLLELKSLQHQVDKLQEVVDRCCEEPQGGYQMPAAPPEDPQLPQEDAILYQNTPNPFSSNTEIKCYLPETTQQAAIYVYNLQGIELKAYPLSQTGLNTVIVNGSELPAGMYFYTLIVDNKIIDTKRMILTK